MRRVLVEQVTRALGAAFGRPFILYDAEVSTECHCRSWRACGDAPSPVCMASSKQLTIAAGPLGELVATQSVQIRDMTG
jgi:hypothetical protein